MENAVVISDVPSSDVHTDPTPEGGKLAWQTVSGCFLILFATFGFQSNVGLLQVYLSSTQLTQYTAFQISWILSTFIFLTLAASIQAGALFDRYGPRYLIFFGSTCYVAMFFLAAKCRSYWSFMLVVGGLGGLSAAVLITVAQSVIGHWFDKRRGVASGIAMLGSAFGGVLFPLVFRYTLPKLGWSTSMYILGTVITICLIASFFLVRGRLIGPRSSSRISLKCFQDAKFLWTTFAIFGYELFVIAGWGLIPTIVAREGFGAEHTFYNVMVISIGSIVGRGVPPWFADRFGRFNVLAVVTFFTVLFLPLLVVSAFRLVIMYIFSFLFGISSGTFVCLSATCIGQICDCSVYGQWLGAADSVASLATLISIPVGIALEGAGGGDHRNGAYKILGYLGGILTMSLVACLIARCGCLGWNRNKFLPRLTDIV